MKNDTCAELCFEIFQFLLDSVDENIFVFFFSEIALECIKNKLPCTRNKRKLKTLANFKTSFLRLYKCLGHLVFFISFLSLAAWCHIVFKEKTLKSSQSKLILNL